MKWRAIILACMIVMSGLFVGMGAQAQVYTGSIVLKDNMGNELNYFDPYDRVYFDATVLEDGAPLQGQLVSVTILNATGAVVFNQSYTTNSFGQFSGSTLAWATPHATELYTIVVKYSGNTVATDTFRVYVAVPWSASGWTEYSGEETDQFTEDQQVQLFALVLDQYGNPYNSGWSEVMYDISFETSSLASNYINTNIDGEASWYYSPQFRYQNQFGVYLVTISNNAAPPQSIGTFTFTVALPDLAEISLNYFGEERGVFREGESIGYDIELFHQTDIPYDSNSYAARVLLYKQGVDEPLRNNTLNTNQDGEASNTVWYTLSYGDEVRGTYTAAVYNAEWQLIGSAIFMVIEITIDLLPEKNSYAQGDTVTITVSTTLEEAYRVRISDSDGVAVPTASWNVPAGTSDWWKDYTFPENLPDGWYSVDVHTGDLHLASRQFLLKKISLETLLSQTSFVPGQQGVLFWRAVNNHDGGPIPITGDSVMHYVDEDWDTINKDLPSISGSSGSFPFTVPRDALMDVQGNIEVDASNTAGHSDIHTSYFNVHALSVYVSTDRNTYLPGDTIFMNVKSFAGSTSNPVPDVDVKLTVKRDGTTVGSAWTVRTNNAGSFSTSFQIPESASKGIWMIVINATFSQNNDVKYDGTQGFDLMTDPIVSLILQQEKASYAPGETVNIPYRVMKNGVETAGAKVTFNAYLWPQINIALGFGNSGVITFTLPANMEGELYVSVTAITTDGLQAGSSLNGIPVTSGQLVLFPDKSIYLPGETVTWSFILAGDTVVNALYRITDPDGLLLAQGTPQNGTFSFQLPAENAVNPRARIYITSPVKSYFASDTAQVYSGYMLEFRILKNSYSPGDTMRINYTIKRIGEVPENVNGFQIRVLLYGVHTATYWVSELSGVLEYRIPDNTTNGRHFVNVVLVGAPGTFTDAQTVIIDSKAGELAHGTILGMNASGFLALIIAIVALIIALVGVMKWKAMAKAGAQAPPVPQTVESYPPPPVSETQYGYASEPSQPVEYPQDTPDSYPPPPQE